jgi:hypothetical protein
MKKNPVDIGTSDDALPFADPSNTAPVRWLESLDAPIDPARLRQIAQQLRPASVLGDREVMAMTVRRVLIEDPDVSAAELMSSVTAALVTTFAQRFVPGYLDDLAWLAEGGVRVVPAGSDESADAPSPALSARIEKLLAREREHRAGVRFGRSGLTS